MESLDWFTWGEDKSCEFCFHNREDLILYIYPLLWPWVNLYHQFRWYNGSVNKERSFLCTKNDLEQQNFTRSNQNAKYWPFNTVMSSFLYHALHWMIPILMSWFGVLSVFMFLVLFRISFLVLFALYTRDSCKQENLLW